MSKHGKGIPRSIGFTLCKTVTCLSHRIGDVSKAEHMGFG